MDTFRFHLVLVDHWQRRMVLSAVPDARLPQSMVPLARLPQSMVPLAAEESVSGPSTPFSPSFTFSLVLIVDEGELPLNRAHTSTSRSCVAGKLAVSKMGVDSEIYFNR